MGADAICIGAGTIEVWPAGQGVRTLGDTSIRVTTFADSRIYHPSLIAEILEAEGNPSLIEQYIRAFGGTKIHRLNRLRLSEIALIEARTVAFFKRTLGCRRAAIQQSWINIYRRGDYAMPHSHPGCIASAVYCIDPGEEDPADPLAGQFCIVDPRLNASCRSQAHHMTNPLMPKMRPGTMILFPSHIVHCVNPYYGTKPRITLAANVALR